MSGERARPRRASKVAAAAASAAVLALTLGGCSTAWLHEDTHASQTIDVQKASAM